MWFLKSRVNAAFVAVFFDKFWHKSLKAEVSQVNKWMLSRKQKFDLWPRLVLAAARLTYQLIECSEFTRQSTEQNRNLRKPRKLLSDSRVELSCPTLTFFFVKCINHSYEPCFNMAAVLHVSDCPISNQNKLNQHHDHVDFAAFMSCFRLLDCYHVGRRDVGVSMATRFVNCGAVVFTAIVTYQAHGGCYGDDLLCLLTVTLFIFVHRPRKRDH